MELEQLYVTYKPLLYAIAYRMLGSVSEAEDAVQDVFVSLGDVESGVISHPKAYLVKMVTNRCLNVLQSAARRKEWYPGLWLPEPQIDLLADEPSVHAIRREHFGYALLVLLHELSPAERAVFLLRESLGYGYSEIADTLHRNESACRKLYSRAKAKIGHSAASIDELSASQAAPYVQAFAEAVEEGRFEPFLRLLAEGAVLISDGGGKVRSALRPIVGRERIVAFLSGIRRKGSLTGVLRPALISGQQGFLLERPTKPPFVFCFAPTADGRSVQAVYLISNPEKLTHFVS